MKAVVLAGVAGRVKGSEGAPLDEAPGQVRCADPYIPPFIRSIRKRIASQSIRWSGRLLVAAAGR